MHALTKIFVVLAAVFAIALSALVVSYAVNTDRVAASYRSLQAQNLAISASAADAARQAQAEQVKTAAEKQDLLNKISDLMSRVQSLEAERSNLVSGKKEAELARQSVENQIGELGETARTQAALIKSYSEEVTTLRTRELDYRNRALDMEDRLSQLESQREVLEQNYRALQEELAELKQVKAPAALAGAVGAAAEDRPFVYSGPTINGSITGIKKDPATGKLLAQLTLGTNDHVAKNMKFLIHRDGQYLGNLVITQSDMQWSVGEIRIIKDGAEIKAGDLVMTASN